MTSTAQPDSNRWLALYVLCAGMLMIVLDGTIVNVALPSIQEDLGFSQSNLAWVVNAYLIAFGGLLLLAGRLGDLLGRRRVFLGGLAVFTAASVACGAAQNPAMLVVARFLQGAGGALTSAVILGMIVTMFPEPKEQSQAIGVYAFVASAGGAVGLLAGGVITQWVSWHWIFFVNLPIGIVTAVVASRLLPSDKGLGVRGGADVIGAVLVTAALMLGVYTIVAPAAEHGWTAAGTVVSGAVSIALLIGFVVRQATDDRATSRPGLRAAAVQPEAPVVARRRAAERVEGAHVAARKFATSCAPCSDRIDSGWTCTPCSGRSRWATPITTASAVAFTRSTSGTATAASEW